MTDAQVLIKFRAVESWQPYLISTLIGLLVGIEREKAHPDQKTMGVRTFLLLALLGAMAGSLTHLWLAAIIAVFSLSLVVISYVFSSLNGTRDYGLTTEFAGVIIFTMGFISHQNPVLATLIGPLVALVLFSKSSLHGFSEKLKPSELQAAILILLLAVSVMNVMSREPIDPWGVLVPRQFGLIVLALAVLEFFGYVMSKLFGQKRGSLLAGFLGGFVSSTAVLVATARQSGPAPERERSLAATAVAAKIASLLELLLLVLVTAPKLLSEIAAPVGAAIAVGLVGLLALSAPLEHNAPDLELRSPLDTRGVLRLSVLLAAILALVTLAQEWIGVRAAQVVAFMTGLFELQGFSLASSTLVAQGRLSIQDAGRSLMFAVSASLLAKIAVAWLFGRHRFSLYVSTVFGVMLMSLLLAFTIS